jgi:hypothetical protein
VNALHKYVVREMSATERRELMGLEAMLCEGIRDLKNHIRADLRRLRDAKEQRAKIRKQLEAI